MKNKVKTDLPIVTIIKFQSLARGFLVRNRIKKDHGFQASPGMIEKHWGKLSNEEVEALHQKVKTQREGLPEFEYGQLGEDDELGVQKVRKPL